MELQPGIRVRVVNQPYDALEGTLVGAEGGTTIPEGGGDLVVRDWRVRRDDGVEVVVPEAALQTPEQN
jgi:hypothetical protein